MTKVEKIKSFNEILETFLQQLSPIVGTTYHFYFKQLIKVNSTMPIKAFLVEVTPYREKIFNKDESYFMDIEENAADDRVNDDEVLTEILRLKDIYSKLDDKSRSEVWNYFQALIVISDEYKSLS